MTRLEQPGEPPAIAWSPTHGLMQWHGDWLVLDDPPTGLSFEELPADAIRLVPEPVSGREGLRPDQVRFTIEAFADSVTILDGGVGTAESVARDLTWAARCLNPPAPVDWSNLRGNFYAAFSGAGLIRRGTGLFRLWRAPDAPETDRMAAAAARVVAAVLAESPASTAEVCATCQKPGHRRCER